MILTQADDQKIKSVCFLVRECLGKTWLGVAKTGIIMKREGLERKRSRMGLGDVDGAIGHSKG